MHYVCIEKSLVSAILNYKPNVPESVKVYEITDEDYLDIGNGVKYFNVSTNKVEPVSEDALYQKQVQSDNIKKNTFLTDTDWQVMRHIREKALGLQTTLTEEQYIALENRRQNIAKSILN